MSATLLDELIPDFHVRSRHETIVDAPAEAVAAAVEAYRLDVDAPAPIRMLFRLRGLPVPSGSLREGLSGVGFQVLAEDLGREVVAGIAGRFWAPREMANLIPVADAREFVEHRLPGTAKGALSIRVVPLGPHRALLSTETRVVCADRHARRLFVAYWTLIRVPSGWIRRALLVGIKRAAERKVAR